MIGNILNETETQSSLPYKHDDIYNNLLQQLTRDEHQSSGPSLVTDPDFRTLVGR